MGWGRFVEVLKAVAPVVLPVVMGASPATAVLVPIIVHAISEADAKASTGAEKKAHAMAVVSDAVAIAHQTGVKGFEEPAAVLNTVSTGIDTVVGVVHVATGARKAV